MLTVGIVVVRVVVVVVLLSLHTFFSVGWLVPFPFPFLFPFVSVVVCRGVLSFSRCVESPRREAIETGPE